MSALSLTNQEIKRNLATLLGISRDETAWSSDQSSDVDRIIRAGRRMFQAAAEWNFLKQEYVTNVSAPYSTGTVTVTDGVVTLSGGTFPSYAAGQTIDIAGSAKRISTRDGDTQVTLEDTAFDAAAGSTYSLYHTEHSLPSSFAAFVSPPTTEGRNRYELFQQAVLPEYELRRLTSLQAPSTGRPELFAVQNTIDSNEYGIPTYVMRLYPLPDAEYVITSIIRYNLDDTLGATDSTEIAHENFAGLIQTAILSAAEKMYHGKPGIHTAEFEQMLPAYIRKDREAYGSRRLLPRGQSRGRDRYYELRTATLNIET